MSIWSRIGQALSALTGGEGLATVFDRLRTPPEQIGRASCRERVSFTV